MTHLEVVQHLYSALARRDGAALSALLAPTFRGTASAGMPGGGGAIRSPGEMLGLWGRVARSFDVHPRPDDTVELCDGRVLVLGHYVGTGRETGLPLDAAFAHVFGFDGDRIASLVQVTDTVRWHQALHA